MKDIFKIKLDISQVKEFITAANSISNNVNLAQHNALASGKSIMGIYSLDLSQPIDLIVYDRVDDGIVYTKFGKWLIND